MSKNEENAHTWSRWSSVYDWVVQRNPLFERPRAREFHLAEIQSSDRVLVIGVGTGLDILHLPRGAEVTGIDVSDAMLERAQAKAATGNCSLHQMNAEDLEFEDQAFDAIIMNCVLSIVENPRQVLREAARVLRPTGSIWILGKFSESPPGMMRRGLNRLTTRVGGVDLTRSLNQALNGTTLRVVHCEFTLAADIFCLRHS